mmetsp:Transcript_19129/g.27207  ORF Transcript_19129/g.27207 Transcript_19129/m.27207 type:complete len:816 (+) Transcript_19129:184-2631(+)|eukprot:CAMPEP_0172418818 /NCGR_PEP_ID=MMETSP1064-20121228/5268_1 /TAXON_ID=202472 /ORGANISM="Aulacoseira subarctica , Strain CCAP 1002/5" /LENGTH=815 /DNA_ID=CAMNT_0013157935 /DNA_START=109 /DNA_END=2556 /DNA_ORIENTATION=+
MGSLCSNPQEVTPRESEPAPAAAAASRPAPAPKPQVARETSTVYREKLINLHDKARRAAHEDKPQSIPEHQEDAAAAPKEQYQRFANVFAAPLKLVEDFVAPVFSKSHDEKEFLEKVLSDNFIFSGLTPQESSLLVNAMQPHHANTNDIIIKQGDIGDFFYVLKKGKVVFLVEGNTVGEATDGATFGELALLYDAPRAATVKALTDCTMYRVDQNTFRTMLANNKAQSEKKRLDLLKQVEIFKDVENAALTKIAEAMTPLVMHDGSVIVRKGDVGEVFYIIEGGQVKISDIGLGDAKYVDQVLKSGEFFGERALVTGEKRAANATAMGDCSLLCISKDTFETIIGSLEKLISNSMDKRKIMGVPIFAQAKLESPEVERLSKMMVSTKFAKGTTLMEEGKPLTTIQKGLYFIKEGEITVTSSKGGVNSLKSGDYFGEDLIHEDPSFASFSTFAVTEDAVCDVITVENIKVALGGLGRLERVTSTMLNKLDASVTLETLKKVKILGSGTFGQVWLVTDKRNNLPYALKIQTKRELIESGQAGGVIREKNLMASLDHPFVIKLVNAFQDKDSLFMVMKLAQGGELFSLLHTDTSDGVPESSARFYAANIFDGLMHMHGRRILYRDLKPENVLIDEDGYCILIDLGFAKVVTDKTYTLCGTPLYLAPEIILSRGYDKGVDNWSFGVLVYEMILGYSPFYTPNIDQMTLFKRIVKVNYSFPSKCKASSDAKDLIAKILVLNPSKRLGSLAGGQNDIRDHPWLASITQEAMLQKEIAAPWKPKIKSPTDTSNFDTWDHLQDKQTVKHAPLNKKEQDMFSEY